MALDATVGGASANSYGTVAEADAYFADRLFTSGWDALSAGDKAALLIWATRIISARITADWTQVSLPSDATKRVLTDIKSDAKCYVVWTGAPSDSVQALAWPRTGMLGPNGFAVPDDEVPAELKAFQFEVALKLAAGDRTEENAATAQGLAGLKAGPVDIKWNADAPNPNLIPATLFQTLIPSWFYVFELRSRNFATIQVL